MLFGEINDPTVRAAFSKIGSDILKIPKAGPPAAVEHLHQGIQLERRFGKKQIVYD
jgi:hypothetical protein